MKKFILTALLVILPAFAMANLDPAIKGKQAENFIRKLTDDAVSTLETTKGDDNLRTQAFKRILNDNFDMEVIARFAMGRYWAVASDQERKKYTSLFKNMVVDVYTKRFSAYTNQKITVKGNKPAGRKDFIVNSVIDNNGQIIKLDWRIRKGKVIDVIVEGVSMSVTQRSEFASVIQRGGGQIIALIDHLEK